MITIKEEQYMKKRVITFIMLVLAIGALLTGCVREETEVRR